MSGKKVKVFGSVNVDMVCRTSALPRPGETVAGGDLAVILGGKGANQAVAAARAGATVEMFGAIGDQSFGLDPVAILQTEAVDAHGLTRCDGPTGAALITVDDAGENCIVVSPGANAKAALPSGGDAGDVHLAQLELDPALVREWFHAAKAAGGVTILNAAPALAVPSDLFALTDYLIVNETELSRYAGLPVSDARSAEIALRGLLGEAGGAIVATLGADGAVAAQPGAAPLRLAPYRAEVRDTTGAGDCFCGVFAAYLAAGEAMPDALDAASAAAALSVEQDGASVSMPGLDAIREAVAGRERVKVEG